MASRKRSAPRKAQAASAAPQVTPMPFPGESPTVALAMAAGEKFGFHPEAKPARASAKRSGAKTKPRKTDGAKKQARRSSARTRAH